MKNYRKWEILTEGFYPSRGIAFGMLKVIGGIV